MERSIAAMGQINLWNLFFRNTWKGALKLIFVATADSLPQNFMKPVRSNGCSYAIRLKQNPALIAWLQIKRKICTKPHQKDQISYAVTYGEFMYQAGSWKYPRRVVFKI